MLYCQNRQAVGQHILTDCQTLNQRDFITLVRFRDMPTDQLHRGSCRWTGEIAITQLHCIPLSYARICSNEFVFNLDLNLDRMWGGLGGSGAILSTADDMARYLAFQLREGKDKTGNVVIDDDVIQETHDGVYVIPQTSSTKQYKRPQIPVTYDDGKYGLGWRDGYYRGKKWFKKIIGKYIRCILWWRHYTETFSSLLALCEWESTGQQWILLTKGWALLALCCRPEEAVDKSVKLPLTWDVRLVIWRRYDIMKHNIGRNIE